MPFSSKPKMQKKRERPDLLSRRAVVMEPKEKEVYKLMLQINTLKKEKEKKRMDKQMERRKAVQVRKMKENEKYLEKKKEVKAEFYKKMGQRENMRKRPEN